MKIKSFFILLLACALLFAGCKVETDAHDSPASPAPSAAPTDFCFYTERILFESARRHMKKMQLQ